MSKKHRREWPVQQPASQSQAEPDATTTPAYDGTVSQYDLHADHVALMPDGSLELGYIKNQTTPAPNPDGLAAGQVYDDVVMDDRPINIHGFRPGYKLGRIVLEAPYVQGGDGWWIASFVGESVTKVYVDAQMLKTGIRVA